MTPKIETVDYNSQKEIYEQIFILQQEQVKSKFIFGVGIILWVISVFDLFRLDNIIWSIILIFISANILGWSMANWRMQSIKISFYQKQLGLFDEEER